MNMSQAGLPTVTSPQAPSPYNAQPLAITEMDQMEHRMSLVLTSMDHDLAPENYSNHHPEQALATGIPRDAPRLLHAPTSTRNLLQTAYFNKVNAYANAHLPPHLPHFRVYIPTYPLLCLAARYSLSAYASSNPTPSITSGPCTTTTIHVPPSLRLGTKAMLLALAPCTASTTPTLVFAIRGSATFADWAVNFRPAPAPPNNFLDDEGNLVHSGFLAVARSSIGPTAEQLSSFLAAQTDAGKWREKGQLLLTGHSAGGAVASLLFAHMLSQSSAVRSPLKDLRAAFKRVHCVTFGVPPLSLLPLERPSLADGAEVKEKKRWKKNLFFSFVNEGDPVVRADRASVRNLLELYAAPVPVAVDGKKPVWAVPENTLSNAGRLVVLRPVLAKVRKRRGFLEMGKEDVGEERVEAVVTNDEQLRRVVFGDPMVHSMWLHKERVEKLAVGAVTGV